MSYVGLFVIVLIIFITIVASILFTVALDNLARLPNPTDSTSRTILDNVISIGTWVILFLIFLLALELTIAVLIYYGIRRGESIAFAYYSSIALFIATIGLLLLEYHSYNEVNLFRRQIDDTIIDSTINMMFWGIILTVGILILSFILIFLI